MFTLKKKKKNPSVQRNDMKQPTEAYTPVTQMHQRPKRRLHDASVSTPGRKPGSGTLLPRGTGSMLYVYVLNLRNREIYGTEHMLVIRRQGRDSHLRSPFHHRGDGTSSRPGQRPQGRTLNPNTAGPLCKPGRATWLF